MKTERTQIHFLSDVLVAVASLVLKVPIASGDLGAMYPVYTPLFLNVEVFHARKTHLYIFHLDVLKKGSAVGAACFLYTN